MKRSCREKTFLISALSIIGTIMKDPNRERSDVLERLEQATALLEQSLDVRIIPAKGTNLAYAIRGARDKNDVAAVQGGIINENGKPRAAGLCAFGGDEDTVRLVLTAMKFDPLMRSAATLRFSKNTLRVIESLLLECTSFDRTQEPRGISTMDWGVASCCKEGVPDVCYDYGGTGKEAIIRILGENPIDVTNNIIMISNRIINIEL
jgi:predicted fused transcriptional regulator/phosphomethylpyrimidine kinase